MQYWAPVYDTTTYNFGLSLEARARIALDLIERFGSVAAKLDDQEDSLGRAKTTLQSPRELVDRCFEIADLFVETAETKGLIRPCSVTAEEIAANQGKLKRITMNQELRSVQDKGIPPAAVDSS